MASRPDRQTLFTVSAGTLMPMPAVTAAWRAVIWPAPGLQHLAHDHVLDLIRADPGPFQGRRDRHPAQIAGRLTGKGPEQTAYRCPRRADNDRLTWFAHISNDT